MIRQLLADYMRTEGCTCCQNVDEHQMWRDRLGEILNIPKYGDGSGYDFNQFRSDR